MFNFLANTKLLIELREDLEKIFKKDTAYPGSRDNPMPSAGHCALVASLIHRMYPAMQIVSTTMSPIGEPARYCSHWLNSVNVNGIDWFIDLTGDQFGYPKVRIFMADMADYKVRSLDHMDEDTQNRFILFCHRYQRLDNSIELCV